jgi:fatty-acyl-CoA synthase
MDDVRLDSRAEMWIEATTLGDLVDRTADWRGDHDALVFPDARVTYDELAGAIDGFARSFRALGAGPHVKVGILMPNCLDFVLALLGAAKLGAIPVPVNGRFKSHELGYVFGHADIEILVTAAGPAGTTDYPRLVAGMSSGERAEGRRVHLDEAPGLRHVVDLGSDVPAAPGFVARADFLRRGDSVDQSEVRTLQQRVLIRDVAMLMYTSGTTSRPKGCMLTHESLVRHGLNVQRSKFHTTPDDRFWDPLPLFHIGGIVPMLGCLGLGATYYHAGHFNPDQALDTLEHERITLAYPAFETIWLQVLDHPRFPEADLSAIRLIQNIAIPERLQQMNDRLPTALQVSSFGATECSSNLTLPDPDDPIEVRIKTLGSAVPGMEIKIVDRDSGEDLGPGLVGELCLRGYARFEGYYKDPELTATAVDAGGWFHTGDLGSIDESGRLTYGGRLKDMFKVGGENVSALEVEDYLARHPAVQIVQVVGVPDDRYGEVAAAFIELRGGVQATDEEVIEFCLGNIATFKVPRYVRFVEEWPMSGTKIQKFVLRQTLSDELKEKGITEAPRIDSRRESVGETA